MIGRLLFQFRDKAETAPRAEEVEEKLGLMGALDREYGVVKVADEGDMALYVIRVDASEREHLEKLGAALGGGAGIFSDTRIEPFGPPE